MSAASAPSSSTLGHVLWNWISNSTASTSDDTATQITCYAFPYGALGFMAHLIMFYGIAWSSFNKCPWNPRKPLVHSKRDLAFGIAGLIISCIFTVVTMYRCSGAKHYLFIASSKISMTLTSSFIGIHIAWNIRGRRREDAIQADIQTTHHKTLWWFIVDFLGSVLELIGVIMLLKESHDAVAKNETAIMIISLVFAGSIGIFLGIGVTWLEVRQRVRRQMEWELHKVQAKSTALEERLAAQQPRGRAPNRREGTPNGNDRAEESPGPDARDDGSRRSGQHEPVEDARRDSPSPVGQERDIEAQGLIAPASESEAAEKPVLYHYQDVLNSAKQILVVAGAMFSLFVTLYTDWILAAVSDSYWGFPTTGNVGLTVVYVVFYFVVRLMPVLSA